MQEPRRRTGNFARHLSYANVVSTLALLFAMTGGALAASHYLITSTKQIKPSVLKKLTPPKPKPAPTYSAGAGLTLNGRQFSLNPSVIPTVPAAFPGSSCVSGDILESLTAGGAATCTSDHVYSATSGSQPLTGDQASVVHVPAGNWVLIGKAEATDVATATLDCKLYAAGNELDESDGYTTASGAGAVSVSVLGTASTTGSSTALEIYCVGPPSLEMEFINIVAIPAAALN